MLILLSVLCVLGLIRFYENYRYLIYMIIGCLEEIINFFVVFLIMVFAFTGASSYKMMMEQDELGGVNVH